MSIDELADAIGPVEAVCKTCNTEFFGGGTVPDDGYKCQRCKEEQRQQ